MSELNYSISAILSWSRDIREDRHILWSFGDNAHLTVKVKVKSLSRVRLFSTPWTVAYQAPLSMEFSRQEYWSGWPFPSPGDLPDPGIEPGSPALQADALPSNFAVNNTVQLAGNFLSDFVFPHNAHPKLKSWFSNFKCLLLQDKNA